MQNLHTSLASLFGFHAFRPRQEDVVQAILDGRDTFTVMPTGGGKSLCYQLPAKLLPGACIVVSPLISLMKDQVDAAVATGLTASAYNSASSVGEKNEARARLRNGTLDLLYVSPERLQLPDFLEFLKGVPISFFAIDEAHCISEWGHDFRPDYLALSSLVTNFPGVPITAFTATATERVANDIMHRLHLRSPLITRASFNRPNLFYQVTPKEDPKNQLLAFLRDHEGESGIIYRITRKNVDKTVAFLQANGIPAQAYHAGLGDKERAETQEAFRRDTCQVVVATIAFGMGIDKPNVRFVVHADLPKNLEGYYQETGRAGRDGEPARCVLFYSRNDIAQLIRFAEGIEDATAREVAKNQLFRMLDFTQKEGCRRKTLLAYFGEELPGDNCGGCDICTGEVEREDATLDVQKLLSAMVRTNCRFGARHCIDIVMGKETSRILSLDHNLLPTFGVGRDRNQHYWYRIMDALLAQGFASIADALLPVPVITETGWAVLRGQQRCAIVRQTESSVKTKRQRKATLNETPVSPFFAILRGERMRLARAGNVPPYVIFSDRTLREMTLVLPDTAEKLLTITGVGEHKLATFGEAFLTLIRDYRKAHPEDAARADNAVREALAPQIAPPKQRQSRARAERSQTASPSPKPARETGDTIRETETLLDEGHSIADVAGIRGLKIITIHSHMEHLVAGGKTFQPERFMAPARLAMFRTLFTAANSWRLAPVVELSKTTRPPMNATFEETRLARILLGGKVGD